MKKQISQTGLTNTDRLTKSLSILMRKSGDLQTVTLEDMIDRHPKIPTEEIVDFLKGLPKSKGDFIAGRRGHPSRFVFGDAQDKWNHMEVVRAEWRKKNGLNPATGGPLKPQRRGRKPAAQLQPARRGRPPGSGAKSVVIGGVTYVPAEA